ncbi:MAG: DNA repair protein RecN [Ruminococcaceae bacterium]|nr:DNA repair protein RecN [Oscillospiraceae bacterium]
MLKSLHIENVAVVKCADIEFGSGFNVLTGETGAGKSVIIDSISMLTGARVSREIIRAGETFAFAEAVFDGLSEQLCARLSELGIECEDGEAIISSRLTSDGKTSARINGRSVTKTVLREISGALISIHGQNDSGMLLDKSSYFDMVDAYGNLLSLREEYYCIYAELVECRDKLGKIDLDAQEKARRRDMLEYQVGDIDSKKLKMGEEEALESERLRLANLEKINKHINFAYRVLRGGERGGDVAYMLTRAAESLSKLSDVLPEAAELSERLTSISYEASDIADEVKNLSDDDSGDVDARLDKIESRLEVIASLKKRYGKDIAAILEFRDKAAAELDDIELSDERADEYRQKITELEAKATEKARLLTQKRVSAAKDVSDKIMKVLSYLDMPKVKLEVCVMPSKELMASGKDVIEVLVATNPGEPMMPVSEIASGGEMSRIMLAIKSVINEKDGIGCAIYDEIDTGISGKTSRKIGVKLHEIARNGQILCVTHSAQIATIADRHYLISKREIEGRAHTGIKLLSFEERVEEAARILGGINITEAQRQAAKDMLADAESGSAKKYID